VFELRVWVDRCFSVVQLWIYRNNDNNDDFTLAREIIINTNIILKITNL
jgi:hypothetical protein